MAHQPLTTSWAFGRRAQRCFGKAAAFAALLGTVSTASAVQITGKVVNFMFLRNPVWEEARDPKNHGFSFREPVPTVGAAERTLYPHIPNELCLALISTTAPPQTRRPVAIRIGGGRAMPVTLVVTPGTLLRFENKDPFTHRLYGVGIQTFPPGETTALAERQWTVPSAGVFEIRDELAPSVRFWVVGDPNVVAVAYPSLSGEFSLAVEAPPPGSYTLQAYFAGKPAGPPRQVELATRDVDLHREPLKVADASKPAAPDEKSE